MVGKKLILFCVFSFLLVFMFSFVVATDCWNYDDDETSCDSYNDCQYHSESWGSWCEQLGCWSLSQTGCSNSTLTDLIGKDCRWKSSNSWGWCEQTSCWSFKDTNESYCENDTVHGLQCEWNSGCNGWNSETNCWDLSTQNTCENVSGCNWGECMSKGCWDYTTLATCNDATGSMGRSCAWNSQYSYCYEASCWDYAGTNESWCETNNPLAISYLNCTWINNYHIQNSCEEKQCWHFDYTNESWCENSSSRGINCTWDGSQYCMMQGCWNYATEGVCDGIGGCSWQTSSGSGWCEELMCWSWDSWSSGNETYCLNSSLNGGLTCAWYNDTYADDGTGWCQQDLGDEACANFTSERECMDTYYCWWEYANWNDVSLGGTCKDPMWGEAYGTGGDIYDNAGMFSEWNPGCYIFDLNATECGYVVGCKYQNSVCNATGNESEHNTVINVSWAAVVANGINCSMINNSKLCNNIPALSTCCKWANGTCSSKMGKSCWENADKEQLDLGIVACEDVSMQTSNAETGEVLCQQIAGYPLYMPCAWSNSSDSCGFKSTNVFGNRTKSFALLDNKKNCESAGGKWISEFYCEGNRSVPAGRCEQKGTNEKNCDLACFACDYKFTGAAHNTSSAASKYCYDSKLGYCAFTADTSAPNGYGYCRAKDEFKKGIASDCKTDCGSCTYTGNPYASTYSDANPSQNVFTSYGICNKPKCYCEYASEFSNVTCKWVADTSSTIGGYCLSSTEKTCVDSCDRCYTRTSCLEDGRKSFNASGSCDWSNSGSETDGACTKSAGGDGVAEICWDGVDNDNDNSIDCADSGCYSDSFCGFVSGDCFGWTTEVTCEKAQLANGLNCTWITDPWGSWCDFPGADCWKSDGNLTNCTERAGCEWTNGTGDGWCEQDWSVGQTCYEKLNNASCVAVDGCTWTNDSWCGSFVDSVWIAGEGSTSNWCTTQGGWCDPDAFAPKNCWNYDGDGQEICDGVTGCYWDGSWCMEEGCWNYDNNQSECGTASGCSWETSDWQNCEVDWSANCWQYATNESWCSYNNCSWRTGSWGNWCDNKFSSCWDLSTQSACEVQNSTCYWNEYAWNWVTGTNTGMCDAKCFNMSLTNTTCSAIDGCKWNAGWCNSDSFSTTSGLDCSANDTDTSDCNAVTGCKWKNPGWCNPQGFVGGDAIGSAGGGASTGMECWKYDGNQTACENNSLIGMDCSWMSEFRPFCEPNWGANCWQFYDNTTHQGNFVCGNTTGCYWTGTYCANVFDVCWNNASYSDEVGNNTEDCNLNPYCNWTTGSWDTYYTGGGWCEPSCFKNSDTTTCTNDDSGSCKWMNGWCNSPGMNAMFGTMQAGAPAMIATDNCASELATTPYLDICGAGMKDMGDSYGFASGTASFAEAGICNNEKIGFSNNFGKGNKTVKYYVYLDTDGSTTGGCSLNSDTSAVGYEFFFKYISSYNTTLGKSTELFSAQRCSSGVWTTADISLSSWKSKMCGEIQGPMIGVEKIALEKFPILYNSGEDMRVYVASAGGDNNASSPSDSAGPGWVTPGAIDFAINGFFELGADMAKFEDILLGGGFVKGEDCYNAIDDDADGLVDCNDWDCEFTPHCESIGINVEGYADTSMPRITGTKVEEYTDSALLMYNTNKPTNGTLTFWYNDSSCSSTTYNRTVYDTGINVASVRTHKLWHVAHLYNDSGVDSLDYNLTNDTTYYYKITICDSSAKCSVSACSSFRTIESSTRCGYCNFVTLISPPTGWSVNYDLNTDGTYEHLQGSMCGPKAGMKTNYTDGRKANIKLNNSYGAEIIFLNVSLTKTGLTGDTRTISTAGDLIYDSSLTNSAGESVGLVGMISETRDKIINNLHPEVCKIKIPSDDCTELWHCDDAGENCKRRDNATTNAPTGIVSGTSCLWTLPYCEFSTWASGNPGTTVTTSTTSTSDSRGSSTTAFFWTAGTHEITKENFETGYTIDLPIKKRIRFNISGEFHYVGVKELTVTTAKIEVASEPQEAILVIGDARRFEVTGDSYYDVQVTLNSITDGKASVTVKAIYEEVTAETEAQESEKEKSAQEKADEEQSSIWLWILIVAVVVIVIIGGGIAIKKRR